MTIKSFISHYEQLFSSESGNRLSIVLQGGVNHDSIMQAATHCRHWRDIFPDAEIILAISSPDVIRNTRAEGATADLTLAGSLKERGLSKISLELIKNCCDKVVQAPGTLPLPPIKTDSPGPNNANLQISAAQAGLAAACGTHILRTRIDLIFADDDFIGQWLEGNKIPYGDSKLLQQRVLISYLYTLNPYTYERMPFHYSDWFHFGLAEDVRALWNVPFMTLSDATFYKTHACAPYSNHQERKVLTKLAVEQHVSYYSIKQLDKDITLNYHNDLTDRKKSIDILCDNFIICDLSKAKCMFDKYAMDFENPAKRLHCIPPEDWRFLASSAADEREEFLLEKAQIARKPVLAPFPRRYPAIGLNTKIGEHAFGSIITHNRSGVLIHGPYDTLPPGRYTAMIELTRFEGQGWMMIEATLGEGAQKLAERHILLDECEETTLVIDFDINDDVGKQFEIVVTIPEVEFSSIKGITVVNRKSDNAPSFSMAFFAERPPVKTIVGKISEVGLVTTGRAGHLMFGPYITLEAGEYTLHVDLPKSVCAGKSHIELTSSNSRRRPKKHPIRQSDHELGFINIPFALATRTEGIEFRIQVDDAADFAVGAIDLRRS